MREEWRQLRQSWRRGLTSPGLLRGWGLLILEFNGLRLLATRPGWSVALVMVLVATLVTSAVQLTQLALTLANVPVSDRRVSYRLVTQHWMTWCGVLVAVVILTVPWGLWGLSSRLLVRLPVPTGWVNFVGLNRRPVLVVAAVIYFLIAGVVLLRGPHYFRRLTPQLTQPGSVWQMLTGLVMGGGLTLLWLTASELLVGANVWVGHLGKMNHLAVASGSLWLILMGFTLVAILTVITIIWSWTGQQPQRARYYRRPLWRLVVMTSIVGLAVVGQTVTQTPQFTTTALISHRGVDHHQAVQNSITALRLIHRQRPTYVEMDLHETKDHQWVVLHDENLQVLAKKRVTPHQLTLHQLQRLTLREDGHQAKLAGWPAYLRTAERLHQRLLVEIKTTPQDSRGMTRRFAQQYGQRLVHDHSSVHSLDYRVVRQLREAVPGLSVGYITPFNWVAPNAVPADFYSFQRISMSQQFLAAAHSTGAPAYVWTPDSHAAMTRVWALGADGQITNELTRLRAVTQQNPAANWWAVIQNFILSYI
ncbi:glycerophosphodiester phosphodiesterase [Levilactobacillus fujinensis]|uniref:Glycerophosphodiester phosphodiesterase n=1 Tax=Levilactobacillus fujinensis TaxID=2486024 RepID=A0ABW1TGQ5_9LACO|nr:glycerophosphodiester phosphodiesterase [Levilactobacillus fujinensis]